MESEGHTVFVANNGREAVTAAETDRFDLVLMDLQMPEMDGLEAAALIRASQRSGGRHLPIIAMTAHALEGDRERCLEAGMDGYTSKPINAEELFAAIESWAFGPEEAAAPLADLAVSAASMVDWPAALKAVRGDEHLLQTIVEVALGEVPRLVAEIHRAAAAGDAQSLRLAAHTLKGSVRYFQAEPVVEPAMRLEAMGATICWKAQAKWSPRSISPQDN